MRQVSFQLSLAFNEYMTLVQTNDIIRNWCQNSVKSWGIVSVDLMYLKVEYIYFSADYRFAPSQWERTLSWHKPRISLVYVEWRKPLTNYPHMKWNSGTACLICMCFTRYHVVMLYYTGLPYNETQPLYQLYQTTDLIFTWFLFEMLHTLSSYWQVSAR